MKLLWIGETAPPEGVQWRRLRETPSLVAVALTLTEQKDVFDAVLLDCRQECPYSMPHILSASSFLRAKGIRLCLLGGSLQLKTDAWLLHCDGTAASAVAMLKELPHRQTPQAPEKADKPPAIAPMQKRQGTLLMLDVLGSQPRIGCTTQCLQLYHYFTALGFSPAIVTTQAQADVLRRLMGGAQAGDTLIMEGVPFVTSAQSGFDCFLRDGGCIDAGKAAQARNADFCVLVAGVKPWEISHTANALTLLRDVSQLLLVASFGDGRAEETLQALLQKAGRICPALAAPWQPDPFTATGAGCYELIRPILKNMEVKKCE